MTGRLLPVNVGRRREVEWEVKIVRTAIWKDPVDGARMVRRLNIEGDDQPDRLAHGGEHRRRPGFYFRVLEEGPVEAGDEIIKIADAPERLTIAQVDGLLYLPGKTHELLERTLRIPALSEGWQESFRELLAKAQSLEAAPAAWPGFRPLRVAETRRESTSIKSFLLEAVDEAPSLTASAGQYLTVRLRPSPDAPPLVRSYSMSDLPNERGYRISDKREGAASTYLHDHVKVGDLLDVAAPRGTFVLRPGTRPIVLISAGVGATPVLAMLHALARERSTRPVWWLRGARNREEQAFAAEADALLEALPDSHRVVAYSRPGPAAALGKDHDIARRLDLAVLERAGAPADADHYLSGPDGFMRAIGAALVARGVALECVATETFGAVGAYASGIVKAGEREPHVPEGHPGGGPTITSSRSDLAVPWQDRYTSLLDFAEACDVPVGFGCRTGVCHNCESGLIAGSVAYHTEALEPPAPGRLLMCCTRPSSELILDL
jgi:ferredoxin-NADP reductase/ferredoxin